MSAEISVTVVIPAYNAQETLACALDSVLAQTRSADEIIVVDDASSDGTAAVAESYGRHGITVVHLPERRGAAAARNAGIRAAKGNWIAFLDADDEWLPIKLEKQVAAITTNPAASFIFCASEEFSPEGRSWGDTFRGGPVTSGSNAWKALLACNFVATPTVVAPRNLLLQLGGFDEKLAVAEDQDMWIRLALAGPPAYMPERLVRVHVRVQSLSSWSLGDQTAYTLPMIERHLATLRDRLSRSEVRAIRGARLHKIGVITCDHGDLPAGLSMVLRSALLGYHPVRGLAMMVRALLRVCLSKPHFFRARGRMAI